MHDAGLVRYLADNVDHDRLQRTTTRLTNPGTAGATLHTFPRTCAGSRRRGRSDLEEDVRVPSAWPRSPITAPDGNGEPLAILLRAGSAGSNTAADHIEATRLALAQLPRRQRRRVLIRTDSGGGTHDFLTWLAAPSAACTTPSA